VYIRVSEENQGMLIINYQYFNHTHLL